MDCSPPDFSVPGILQARMLEWVAISFSRVSIYKVLKIVPDTKIEKMEGIWGDFLVVQWLGLSTFNARTTSIPGQGSKILHAAQCGQK